MTGLDIPADRGQIALITVVVLSTLFVALALFLNGAIYAENLSTRGTTDSDDAVVETAEALESVDELIDRTNRHHNATHETATENFTSMVDAVAAVRRAEAAEVGAHSHVAIVDQTNGTHVRQLNDSRAFTDASGALADWTVVEDARGISDYRLTVQRSHLHTDAGDSLEAVLEDSFAVHVSTTDGASWTLHVYEDADGEVAVRAVHDGEVQAPCTAGAETVSIDLVDGTVDGDPCATLSFAHGLSGAVDIEYRNPGRIAGSYGLRVDRILGPATDDRYEAPGEGSPSATPNIYAATVEVSYETADVGVTREHRLEAGDNAYAAA